MSQDIILEIDGQAISAGRRHWLIPKLRAAVLSACKRAWTEQKDNSHSLRAYLSLPSIVNPVVVYLFSQGLAF